VAVIKTILFLLASIAATVTGIFAFAHYGFLGQHWAMLASMLISVVGAIISGMFIAMLMFPKTIPVMLANQGQQTFKLLKTAIGRKKRSAFGITQAICMFTLGAITIASEFTLMDSYIKDEIQNYGRVIKVGINDIHYTRRRSIDFSFVHNNNLYTHSFSSSNLQVGDSIQIIYSPRMPHLVRWANEYK
jgi:hypothetical protein